MNIPFSPSLRVGTRISSLDTLAMALELREAGFSAATHRGLLRNIPAFQNPLVGSGGVELGRRRSKRSKSETVLHRMAPSLRSRHLEACVLFQKQGERILRAAEAGDGVATEALLDFVVKILNHLPSKPPLQQPARDFYENVRRYARRCNIFPFLLGGDRASLESAWSRVAELELGKDAALSVDTSAPERMPEVNNPAGYARLAMALIEYFELIRTMQINSKPRSQALAQQLARAGLNLQFFDRIRTLRAREVEDWDSWHSLAVDFLKFRYGTLKAACGGGADLNRSENPSTGLKRSFKSIFKRLRRA